MRPEAGARYADSVRGRARFTICASIASDALAALTPGKPARAAACTPNSSAVSGVGEAGVISDRRRVLAATCLNAPGDAH
eukprot:544622-Prymnesium_polylepis.1